MGYKSRIFAAIDVDQLDKVPSLFRSQPRNKTKSTSGRAAMGPTEVMRNLGKNFDMFTMHVGLGYPLLSHKRKRDEQKLRIGFVDEDPEVEALSSLRDMRTLIDMPFILISLALNTKTLRYYEIEDEEDDNVEGGEPEKGQCVGDVVIREEHITEANYASGMAVNDECKLKFWELKAKRNYRFIMLRIEEKIQQVMVEMLGEPDESYEDFSACLPPNECRYAVFDLDFTLRRTARKARFSSLHGVADQSLIVETFV
ncbi:hypothetical protein GIB67_013667 [Kingdonia uniflora]|uniref:ADF-H domain-containing protein n=1 Tax=Kingdonia uniflora TaxID=39325 RepID=A0A7J7NPV4_9MAGN|nr:hypothetical protein GIB67_013667 [Kingdonia uniflora]